MSIFSVFEVFTVFCIFRHKGKCFEHGKGDIRDQQHKTNQNMYKKLKKQMCSNFALFAPYNHHEGEDIYNERTMERKEREKKHNYQSA
jgi:hypothetical protein